MNHLTFAAGLLLCAGSASATEPAALSPETRLCFEWYETLGLPPPQDAVWAEVWTGRSTIPRNSRVPEPVSHQAFVWNVQGDTFQTWDPDMNPLWLRTSLDPAAPHRRTGFSPRPFQDAVRLAITIGNNPGSPLARATMGRSARPRLRLFTMAHAAWKSGDPATAQALYRLSEQCPAEGAMARGATARVSHRLYAAVGDNAMQHAIRQFQAAVPPAQNAPAAPGRPPRQQLLTAFQEVVAKFPEIHEAPRARNFVKMLTLTLEEEPGHLPQTGAQLRAMPPETRITELIWQIRNQTSRPGEGALGFEEFDGPDTAVHHLVAMGLPAVPRLIQAMGDDQLTRCVRREPGRDARFSVVTVGECAAHVLSQIAGENFTFTSRNESISPHELFIKRRAAQAWWDLVQAKGEQAVLAEAIATAKESPLTRARLLKAKYPEALADAVLAGAAAVTVPEWSRDYATLLGDISSDRSTAMLIKFAETKVEPTSSRPRAWMLPRAEAARQLWIRDRIAATPIVLKAWHDFPLTPAAGDLSSFTTLLQTLLVEGGTPGCDLMLEQWARSSSWQKHQIMAALALRFRSVLQLPKSRTGQMAPLGPDKKRVIAHLATMLEDTTPVTGLFPGVQPIPRLCDQAAWALNEIDPANYPRTPSASRQVRDKERFENITTWGRQTRRQPERASVDPAVPSLNDAQIMQITEVTVQPPTLAKVFEEWKGRSFEPSTTLQLTMECLRQDPDHLTGIFIEAVRDRGHTGVRLAIHLRSGSPKPQAEWNFGSICELDGKIISLRSPNAARIPSPAKRGIPIVEQPYGLFQCTPESDFVVQVLLEEF